MSQATQSHTRWLGHSEELWQNMVHWRRKWQPIPVFLPQESPEQYEKAKRYDTGKQALQVGRFNMLPGKTEGRLLTVMRWLDSITNSISKLWLIVENSDKTWSTRGGNGKPLQYSCLDNPMNSMKRQKDMTLEDAPPQVRKCPICYWGRTGGQLLIALERMKQLGQSRNDAKLWMCLVVKLKSDTLKNNTA